MSALWRVPYGVFCLFIVMLIFCGVPFPWSRHHED